ncbi:hypothetical protein MANES_11G134150v8 [Manihot esculenta]|uniref:Uncharacterized protein n=1 Tax=Manihot esculenta TaxID=3983 RepID=A0ACB7GYB7_MANES|nr:hypothetical protein MANES_11G134150v8 [Manihot esculenta]
MERMMMELPHGYYFEPTLEELLFFYLQRKLQGKPLPPATMEEFKEPSSTGYFYVFTKLKKRSKDRVDRTAGSGVWNGRTTHRYKDPRGSWLKKDFIFQLKKKQGSDSSKNYGRWIMMELSFEDIQDSYVLCRIYNKNSLRKKARIEEDEITEQEECIIDFSDDLALNSSANKRKFSCDGENGKQIQRECKLADVGEHFDLLSAPIVNTMERIFTSLRQIYNSHLNLSPEHYHNI